MTIQITNINV